MHINRAILAGFIAIGSWSTPTTARAQWSRTYEQFYMPGAFNWTFRREYAGADRLFNAFDYGHAILYERLYNEPMAPASLLENDEYDFITKKLLVSPPRLPLEEAAIEVNYAKMAPEAKQMFDWAHLLHRQIYDVLASENMTQEGKDAKIAELVTYYKTRPDLAFSSVAKNMDLMESQPYSLAFRQRYPKFNGLIWGYHWLQVGLYEPLMVGRTREERQSGVTAAVARFKQMLENAPEHMPRIMPMTAGIAPVFAARYPEASIIFDNLHAMHDVVSDILTNNEKVPRNRKRAAILEAASRYRDATSFAMPMAEWRSMGTMMGVENMGGPAVGFLAGFPKPTLARGASMADAMKGMQHGATGGAGNMAGMAHAGSGAAKGATGSMAGMNHGPDSSAARGGMPSMPGMVHGAAPTPADSSRMMMQGMMMQGMMEMHTQMMRDPVIRERVMADTTMRRMMNQMDAMHGGMKHDMPGMNHDAPPSAEHSHEAKAATRPRAATPARRTSARAGSANRNSTSSRKSATARKASAKRAAPAKTAPAKAAPAKAAPMDHSRMPGMKMPGMKP